jgi:hypothetical protein
VLCKDHQFSERRACGLIGISRSSHAYNPCHEFAADIFWPIVHSNNLRLAPPFDNPVQTVHHPFGWQREIHFDTQTLTVKIIQHVQGADRAAVCKLVGHGVHRPRLAGAVGNGQGIWLRPLQAFVWVIPPLLMGLTCRITRPFSVS